MAKNITLSVPDSLYDTIREYKQVNWSEIARLAFKEYLKELQMMEDIKTIERGMKQIKDGKFITHNELIKKYGLSSSLSIDEKDTKVKSKRK